MEDLQTEYQKRQTLYDTMIVNSQSVIAAVKRKTDLMLSNKDRYLAIAHTFPNPCLTWDIVCTIHEMECTQNFNKYLGNGQNLDQVTTIVPAGRGPFATFEDGAIDALNLQLESHPFTDCSIGGKLYWLEGYNGYGYENYHHINSPYLWSGSQWYIKGKYTSDGQFDPEAVSQQIGVALLLKSLLT